MPPPNNQLNKGLQTWTWGTNGPPDPEPDIIDTIIFVRNVHPRATLHEYERPTVVFSVDNIHTKVAYEITKDETRLIVLACGETEIKAWENAKRRIVKDEMKNILAAEELAAIKEAEAIEAENKAALIEEYKDEHGRFIKDNPGPAGFRGKVKL
jgi:hypothetical protein